jgi:hypothetical protein
VRGQVLHPASALAVEAVDVRGDPPRGVVEEVAVLDVVRGRYQTL